MRKRLLYCENTCLHETTGSINKKTGEFYNFTGSINLKIAILKFFIDRHS